MKMKKNTGTHTQSQAKKDNKSKERQEWEKAILDRMGAMRDKNGRVVSKPDKEGYITLY